jgi:hypothetical protein
MRLQQILQFFSRSRAQPADAASRSKAEANPRMASNCDSASGHTAPDRLALQTAIIHHLEWCVLFNEHLSLGGSDRAPLEPLPNATDSCLGQWLQAIGHETTVSGLPLNELQAEHHRFHAFAQQALAFARQGRMDLASTLLNTDFERSRARVLELLRSMQKA